MNYILSYIYNIHFRFRHYVALIVFLDIFYRYVVPTALFIAAERRYIGRKLADSKYGAAERRYVAKNTIQLFQILHYIVSII